MRRRQPWLTRAAAVLVIAGGQAQAQTLVPHLAVYEVVTGRAPAGVTPPEITGTYVFRLQDECGGGMKFEQRLRFEARGAGGATVVDQTTTGWEADDGKRYRFTHKNAVDSTAQPEMRGEAELGDGEGEAKFSRPVGRVVPLPAGTLFPISILRRAIKAAADGESGFEGKFFMGDKPEAPQTVAALLGKPPRRVLELPPPQGDRALVSGRQQFYFRVAFYDDKPNAAGEPRHEMSSVTLDNGVEIWGTHEQGELRLEYRLTRIERVPPPRC